MYIAAVPNFCIYIISSRFGVITKAAQTIVQKIIQNVANRLDRRLIHKEVFVHIRIIGRVILNQQLFFIGEICMVVHILHTYLIIFGDCLVKRQGFHLSVIHICISVRTFLLCCRLHYLNVFLCLSVKQNPCRNIRCDFHRYRAARGGVVGCIADIRNRVFV